MYLPEFINLVHFLPRSPVPMGAEFALNAHRALQAAERDGRSRPQSGFSALGGVFRAALGQNAGQRRQR